MRHPLSRSVVILPSLFALTSGAIAANEQPEAAPAPLDWRSEESGALTNYVQLTSEKDFVKKNPSASASPARPTPAASSIQPNPHV